MRPSDKTPDAAVDEQERRAFVKGGLALLGLATLSSLGCATIGERMLAPQAATRRPTLSPIGEPYPSYLPAGFAFSHRYLDRPDGFRVPGEVALWYLQSSKNGYNNPLAVFIAPSMGEGFGGARGRQGANVQVQLQGGTVSAAYHSGMGLHGEKTPHVHALIFPFQQFVVGIRGSRLVGVDEGELTRVAESLRV